MSQRRQKKQLSTMDNIESLTDHELREALKGYSQAPGPITESTRNLYRRKLATLIDQGTGDELSTSLRENTNLTEKLFAKDTGVDDEDDDDTSDEDYIAQDEEESEDEDLDEEEESESDDEDELVDELDEDSVKLPNLSTESGILTTSMIAGTDATPNRISRGILMSLVGFFVVILSYYIYSGTQLFGSLRQYKTATRELLTLFALSLFGYTVYQIVRFYRKRRREEMQRVCGLVSDVMELLQSPDNPKGLMPVLHIRDTLLTPPERKNKKMIKIWNKAVNFIEEHESRVKVELVNIDGEDFRAWKWIGSRKL